MPEITHFVAGLGTSGTLMGVGRYLKEHRPDVQVWAVEPPSGEMVDGLRSLDDGYVPPIFTDNDGEELLDRKVIVRPRESIEWTRRLAELGLFVGISSGAAMAGAVKCAATVGDDEGPRSSPSSPTTGGSTSRPARGATTSTRSSNAPGRRSTSKPTARVFQYRGHALIVQ